MSSKLKAGTSTSGAVLDADTTGILELQTGSTPTTAITIDTSQNVGIGTTSPSGKLDISGSTGNISLRMIPTVEATNVADIRTLSVRRISTDSVLGIGYATSPDAWFISASFGSTGSNKPIAFATADTERMRIDTSGNLLVGTASGLGGKVSVLFDGSATNGVRCKTSYASNGSQFVDFLNSSGTQIGYISQNASNTVNYSTSSDYRLKEDIAPMTNALATVSALKPVTYKWKADGSNGQGFIAHELAKIVSDCVTGEKDAVDAEGNPKYQGIDTSFLVATLTAAIQELNAKVIALEAKVGI
jgi:hypothetical protein